MSLSGRSLSARAFAGSRPASPPALFLSDEDDFGFSYGVAGRVSYFFQQPLAGPHAGVAVEVLRTRVEDDANKVATLSTYVVPELEGGYRLALGNFFVGGVLAFGYAAQADSRIEDLPGGNEASRFTATDESSLYGSARLDLGLYF